MQNLAAVLEAAGTSFDKVLKTTCYLSDMTDFAAFNEVYAKYFVGKPARSCFAVKGLPKNVLVEVELIAELWFIDHLQKTKAAILSSENSLRLVNNKADELSIKKLTKNALSVRTMFDDLKREG